MIKTPITAQSTAVIVLLSVVEDTGTVPETADEAACESVVSNVEVGFNGTKQVPSTVV